MAKFGASQVDTIPSTNYRGDHHPDAGFGYQIVLPNNMFKNHRKILVEVVSSIPHSKATMQALLKEYMSIPHLEHIIVVKYQESTTLASVRMVLAHYYCVGGSWMSDLYDIGGTAFDYALNWFRDNDSAEVANEYLVGTPGAPTSLTITGVRAPICLRNCHDVPVDIVNDIDFTFEFARMVACGCSELHIGSV